MKKIKAREPKRRLRWWIAVQLNRLRGQCWTDLVNWALHDQKDDPDFRSHYVPWSLIGDHCQRDAQQAGTCYCGKLDADGYALRRGEKRNGDGSVVR